MSNTRTTTTTPTIADPTGALAQAPSLAQFAGMVGSSIATKDSTPWVLHFLSAAYYTKADDERVLTDIEAGDVGVMLRGDEGWRMMERRRVLGNVRTLKRSKGR